MTDLGLINCLKGIWSLSIHKIVFHKSTIHLFSTKIHNFFEKQEKKLTQIQQIQQKINEFYWGDRSALGLLWVRLGLLWVWWEQNTYLIH